MKVNQLDLHLKEPVAITSLEDRVKMWHQTQTPTQPQMQTIRIQLRFPKRITSLLQLYRPQDKVQQVTLRSRWFSSIGRLGQRRMLNTAESSLSSTKLKSFPVWSRKTRVIILLIIRTTKTTLLVKNVDPVTTTTSFKQSTIPLTGAQQ